MLIAKNGKAKARLILPDEVNTGRRVLAKELQSYIRRISGVTLEIGNWNTCTDMNAIHLGSNERVCAIGVKGQDLEPGGFRIRCLGRDLVLVGRGEEGVAHAVYSFLERFCGVRWLWPGSSGEIVPKTDLIEIDEGEWVEEPSFRMRHLPVMSYIDAREGWPNEFDGDVGRWRRRHRLGGNIVIQGVHSFGSIAPPRKYYATHPEYYALVDGIRGGRGIMEILEASLDSYGQLEGWQLCTTNPDVIDLATRWADNELEGLSDHVAVNISPNDGLGFCQCETCTKLDTGETTKEVLGRPLPVLSERVFTYANEIAKRVSHKDRLLSILAYSLYRQPPKDLDGLEDNLIVQYCILGCTSHYIPKLKERDLERLARWKDFHGKLAIYEYLSNNHWPCIPRPVTRGIARAIPEYRNVGAMYFFAQSLSDWATNGPNYYLAAKLLWDCKADPEEILSDYFHSAFGDAATPLREYFREFEEAWIRVLREDHEGLEKDLASVQSRNIRPDLLLTDDLIERCEGHLRLAEARADGPEVRARIAFVRRGFQYTKAHHRAMHAVIKLILHGVPLSPHCREPGHSLSMVPHRKGHNWEKELSPVDTTRMIDEAIDLWEEREALVESLKDDLVIDYRWVRMCDSPTHGGRGFPFSHVLDRLRELKAEYESFGKTEGMRCCT